MIRPRLSFMGSRRWNTAEGSNGGGGGRMPVPGTVAADSAICEILDTYDRRLDEQSEADRAREEQRLQFRETSERLLRTIVEPAMGEIGREILARGHVWTVEERIDIQGQPAIACLFRARETGPTGGPGSELTFRCLFPDRVSTTAVVRQGEVLREFPARSHLSGNVNEELVRNEIARFLSLVLDRA